MATVRELFDTSSKALNARNDLTLSDSGMNQHTILRQISYCFVENAKYWSFFVPEGAHISCVEYIFNMPETSQCIFPEDAQISQIVGYTDSPERHALESFKFTGRIYLYIDAMLSSKLNEQIVNIGSQLGFSVMVRDKEYVKKCSELSKPLAFISHDSKDKDSLVRELAREMSIRLCSVWYDEYSLNVGDSLRESIERGLKEARKCVLILSPNFLSNNGWAKAEFNSIYTREIHEGKNVMLPVWHNVGKNEVYEFSPLLANKVALSSSLGVKELAKKLANAVDG